MFRIASEAIINAYRHTGARDIEARISYGLTELRATVRDNGCGIDPDLLDADRRGHWGLAGMRERADRIGAKLRVLSRLAIGTEVCSECTQCGCVRAVSSTRVQFALFHDF
jgi:signal transduction histidine kinase